MLMRQILQRAACGALFLVTLIANAGAQPPAPAPNPTAPAGDVISLYSNAYVNQAVDTWSAVWDLADVTDVQIAGNDAKLYTNLVFAGIEFTSQVIDASAMTHFHMDVWAPTGTVFRVKLVDFGADGTFGGGNDSEYELSFNATSIPPLVNGAWVSLEVPLLYFTGLASRAHLAQLIISGDAPTVYVDNVHFLRQTSATHNRLVNPSFEAGLAGWIAFGNVYSQAVNPPQFVPYEGNGLVSMFGNFSGGFNVSGMFQEMAAVPGTQWRLSAKSRHFSGDALVGIGAASCGGPSGCTDNWVVQKIAWFDAGNNEIGGVDATILDGTFATDAWHANAPIVGVAPPGTVKLQALILYLQPLFAGGAAHIDNVELIELPIATSFDFTPGTLNLASQGLWVTGYLEPASPFAAGDIDLSSIRLNGTVPVDPAAPTALGDHDGNGIPDLMVKFNRAAVELILSEGNNVAVNVTGTLGGHPFAGTDYIRVRRAVVSAPLAGSRLTAGSVTQVRWETPGDIAIESVALLGSLDAGVTWSLIANGQPNTGSYNWTVPNVQTDQAKLAVVLVESADETGFDVQGVMGVSESFAIDALVGVGGETVRFALRGVSPNPARDELRVTFSLKDSKPATLALFDVSGRQIAARRVDGMGPGWQSVTLGERARLSAGVYVIRLTQDGRSLTTRAALVR